MTVRHYESIEQNPVDMEGAVGCQVRWLIGQPEGAPHFAMRQFEVAVNGHTPRHTHPYEHEVFVLDGTGCVLLADHEHPIRGGDVVYVPANQWHQFRNTGPAPLKFLCLVPNSATGPAMTVTPECGS